MQSQKNQYLGEGRIFPLMLKFSIPCVLSLLLSSLYNVVDQIFVGNSELSTLGNAATGVVFPLFIIAQAFAWCFGDGCAAYLNICQGRNDAENAHRAIGTGITATVVVSLVILALFYPFKLQILTAFGASENNLPLAIEYFDIILAFFPAYMLFNMMNAVIRSDGSPAWSMASVLAGAIVNIILDPLFIFGFHWGMAGAAWATVIGQVISLGITLYYYCIHKPRTFRLTARSFLPHWKEFSGALKLGMPSFTIQATIVIISLACNMMLARYGAQSHFGADIPIAIFGIESKVYTVVVNLVIGIVLGCQPIISYNIGARKHDRVKSLYRMILLSTLVIGAVFTLLFELAPDLVVGIFGSPTNIPNPEDYWIFGQKTFRIFLMFIIFNCFMKMTAIFLQSAGYPVRSIAATTVRDILCFTPLVILLPRFLGVEGVLYAGPIADCVAMLVALIFTILFMRTLKD